MKIMIVDDEVIIRTGLAKVIKWNEIGIELLEPAASAEEALMRMKQERPHILLTDIRMKGKTGLELAEEAKRMLPELEVIVLSGYDDFAYMQQAIRQEVGDYLLKSSRPDEIMKTVLKARQRIEEKWRHSNQDHYKNKEVRNRLFERWVIEGETDGTDPLLLAQYLPRLNRESSGNRRLQTLIVSAEGWGDSPSAEALLLFAVNNMLGELLPCDTLIQKNRIVAAVELESGIRGDAAEHQAILAKIERQLKCSLFIACGDTVSSSAELHHSFTTADYVYGYKGLLGKSMLEYARIVKRQGGKTVCTQEEEQQLSSILLEDDPVLLKAWVKRYVQEQLEDPDMTLESLESLIRSAALSAHRWLERVLTATGRAEGTAASPKESLLLKRGYSPVDVLYQHLNGIMKLYHEQLGQGQATHAQKAMAYIEEHMGKDVGLQQVARFVHLHPNHLSEVFKKEVGMTFGDYVTRQKMRRAMEILSVSPAKVSEVAARVGFEDVKYFSQVFKKFTGKTPSEYREEAAQAVASRPL
ncbi:response regulator transcription factor [Paenibacillus puerhi]|uniref:response regulator transcription factor n=1 Tax=Paenibacillus puerhi TaxID=2692622 RepID=UPI001357AB93|nr:helix-turn-helix domain-containing protein [Paenibacillus puerhi]